MPEYPRPGVYVEALMPSTYSVRQLTADRRQVRTDDDAVSRRRWSAATTTAVFFGFAEMGPIGDPVAVTEWPQFADTFGGFLDDGYLGYAVYGFLANGGMSCHVIRIDPDDLLMYREDYERWFETRDDVSLVCAPDLVRTTSVLTAEAISAFQHWLVALCESCDLFAIIDPPADLAPDAVAAWRKETMGIDSRAATTYYPWLKMDDPTAPGWRKDVPPSGHVAGVIAHNDLVRGFHTAPGNRTVHSAEDVVFPMSQALEAYTAPIGINSLVLSPGRGVVVWGARTLSSDPDWRYLRRHRLLSFLIHQVRAHVRATESTDLDLAAAVSELCHLLWRSGALVGDSADDAYAVSLGEAAHGDVTIDCVIAIEREFSVSLRIRYLHE